MLSNFRLVDWASHGDIIRTYAMHVSLKENRICIVGLSNQASGNHSIGTTCVRWTDEQSV